MGLFFWMSSFSSSLHERPHRLVLCRFGGASEISGPRPIVRVRADLFPSQTPQTPPRHARHPSATLYINLVCRCECLSSFDSPIPRYFDITLHDPRDTLQSYLLEVVLVLSGQSLRP